jgi:tetratricopeptide (TPR) repeat protein
MKKQSAKATREKTTQRAPRASARHKKFKAALTELVTAELVHPAQERDAFQFEHALVLDATYGSLLKQERTRLHYAVAETLEREYKDAIEPHAAELAHHFEQAGVYAKTFEYALRAAIAAARVYASTEAITYYSLALAAAQHITTTSQQRQALYLQRGHLFELRGQFQDAFANYGELQELGVARGERSLELAALVALGALVCAPTPLFDAQLGNTLSSQGLALARDLDDRAAEATILRNLMLLNNFQGHARAAVQYGEESLTIGRALGLDEQVASTLNELFRSYCGIGQFERAGAAMEEAREFWRRTNNLPVLADNLGRSARVALALGEFDQAIRFSQEARQISEQIGSVWGQAFSRMFVSYVYVQRGEFATAIQLMQDCIRMADEAGFVLAQIAIRADLGWLLGSLGAILSGRELARMAYLRAEKHVRIFRAWALADLARLNVLNGDLTAAAQSVREGYAALPADWAQHAPVEMALAEAELALAKQDYGRAIAVMDELLMQMREIKLRTFLSDALFLKGTALFRLNELDAAAQVLHEAYTEASSLGARRMLWQILAAQSEIELARGNDTNAESLRAQARSIIQEIAEHTPNDLRTSFLNLPCVREMLLEQND